MNRHLARLPAVLLLFLVPASPAATPEIQVAAAADLAPAQAALIARFQKATGLKAAFIIGSSGILARQIENGAPYDVFLSANESLVTDLAKKNKIQPASVRNYATGRLAWYTNTGIESLDGLTRAKFIAIPNPVHAPYGVAAKQALIALGLWSKVEGKIVLAENARQAFAFAESKNAEVAITAWTILKPAGGKLIDAKLHQPIRQTAGIVAASRQIEGAGKFLDFLVSPQGQAILSEAGLGSATLSQTAAQRGYTIPMVDLSAETSRQTIVDRESGQYLGHPTTVLLEDGKTILIVYPKGHGRGAIQYKRSMDRGKTWSKRLPVPDNWATSQETPTIHRVIDPKSGKKRLILFSGLYPIRQSVSEDDGKSWTPLKSIGDFGGIVAMADVVRLKGGDYMAVFHDDGRFLDNSQQRGTFRVFKVISRDGGLTWSKPEQIATHKEAHLCEPGIVRSPDGSELAMLMRDNSRKFNSFISFSRDEGATWTEPRELPGSLTGDRHTAKYAKDGRLFITFRDTTLESPTKGDWVGWLGRYEDLRTGAEGQYRIRLMDNKKGSDCCYPGLERLPDGSFLTTTYGHWTEGEQPYIVAVRFHVRELDAKSQKR